MKTVRQETNEQVFPYIALIPEEISEHPAIIFQLHGAGERGNGGAETDKVLIHGWSKVVTDQNLKDCILIMPQCPSDTFWAAKVESIKRFIDLMVENFSADKKRIYLCGLSMGGFGTWYTAMAYPELFAAIAPCCGGGMPWNAETLKMPVWAFHGLDDTVVLPHNTTDMIDALKGVNPNLKWSLYEGVGHNAWDLAFSEETLFWMLSQSR